MNFLQKLLRALGFIQDTPAIRFEQSLQNHISQMAELEHRSENEVANDLLFFALEECQRTQWVEQCWQGLSPREQEVTALVCLGYTDQEIALRLNISVNTARTHVRNIRRKFGVNTKADLRHVLSRFDFSSWENNSRH